MSEEDQTTEIVGDEEDDATPSFNFFIKASLIDKSEQGSCPVSQQWYMVAHLLAQKDNVSFKVFTVPSDFPPKCFTDITTSRQFPIIQGKGGRNVNGSEISDLLADSYDEVEKFFEEVNRDCRELKRTWAPNQYALKVMQEIHKHFNAFLLNKDKVATLQKDLINLNGFLEEKNKEEDEPFLTGDELSYADCFLLPRLQHIRVAGSFYRDFDIPDNLTAVWKYLENGYKEPAFVKTLPSDRDIINHYIGKAPDFKPNKSKPYPHLMPVSYTRSVVKDIVAE